MNVKFSEDIVPLSDLKVNPGKVIRHVTEEHRPVLLTSRGRGVAVVLNLQDFESAEEERLFMRAVVKGMVDLEEGREKKLQQVKKELGLK
jgi:prevent-host-death family protein